jgi:hypothetical protein
MMSRVNWRHSGTLLTAAGFLWVTAAVSVVFTEARLTVPDAAIIVLVFVLLAWALRPERGRPH